MKNYDYCYHDNQGRLTMKVEVVNSGINWQVKRLSCTTGGRFVFSLIIRRCLSRLRSASSCRLSWGFHSVLSTAEDSETKQSPFWPHKPSKKKKARKCHFCVCSVKSRKPSSVSTAWLFKKRFSNARRGEGKSRDVSTLLSEQFYEWSTFNIPALTNGGLMMLSITG